MTCVVYSERRGRYPWIICHAVVLVDELPTFKELPDTFRNVLRTLIKRANRDDAQIPILMRRQTIADDMKRSLATVFRALKDFELRGWIQQREKKARHNLIGSDSEIVFTKILCDLLELPYEGKKVTRPSEDQKPHVTSDRSYKAIGSCFSYKQSSQKQSDEFSQKDPKPTPEPAPQKDEANIRINGQSVPKDLGWLVIDKGLSLPSLFKLMKLAKGKKKLLSDIAICVKDAVLKNAKLVGRAVYGYLHDRIYSDQDYSYVARKAREDEADRAAKAAMKATMEARMTEMQSSLQGKTFRSEKNGETYTVSGSQLQVKLKNENKERIKVLDYAFVLAIDNGDVVPCDGRSDMPTKAECSQMVASDTNQNEKLEKDREEFKMMLEKVKRKSLAHGTLSSRPRRKLYSENQEVFASE